MAMHPTDVETALLTLTGAVSALLDLAEADLRRHRRHEPDYDARAALGDELVSLRHLQRDCRDLAVALRPGAVAAR